MARLQRKKSPSVKKKKKQSSSARESVGTGNDVALKKTALLSRAAKDIKKTSFSPKSKVLTKAKREPGKLKSFIDKGLQFLREVKVELKKVVWPTRKQTISSTIVVLILTMIISFFLGVVDMGLAAIIRLVLQ